MKIVTDVVLIFNNRSLIYIVCFYIIMIKYADNIIKKNLIKGLIKKKNILSNYFITEFK